MSSKACSPSALLFAGLSLTAPSVQAAAPYPGDEPRETIDRLLADAPRAGPERCEEIAAELAGLGARAIPLLFDRLVRVPETTECQPDPFGVRPADESKSDCLRSALRKVAHADLVDFLERAQRSGPDPVARQTALRLLADVGRADDLPLLTRLATLDGAPAKQQRGARTSFELALTAILAREPQAVRALPTAFEAAPDVLLASLVRAAGSVSSFDSVRCLVRMLGRHPDADSLILAEVARLGAQAERPVDDAVRARVRPLLDARATLIATAAIHAVAALEDSVSAERLVDLCGDARPGVPEAARAALRELAGRDLGPSEASWRAWHDEQAAWWSHTADSELASLGSCEAAQAARILKALPARRLVRHEISDQLDAVFRRPEADLAVLAASVLGSLGSPKAERTLTAALGHPDPRVRQEARRALQRIFPNRPAEAIGPAR